MYLSNNVVIPQPPSKGDFYLGCVRYLNPLSLFRPRFAVYIFQLWLRGFWLVWVERNATSKRVGGRALKLQTQFSGLAYLLISFETLQSLQIRQAFLIQ